jgi:hypothetical protein
MAWVGLGVLVLAGVIALVLSVREDKRARAPREESAEASAEVPRPRSQPTAEAESAPAPEVEPAVEAASGAKPAVDDAAVRARIAALAAELKAPSEVAGEPATETNRETTAREAERVFASVAAVGRATPEHEEELAPEPEPEPVDRVTPAVAGEAGAGEISGAGHEHERPVANHSDLLAHVRREHTHISTTGSTIQMRILHERAHAAPPTDA